MSDLDRQVRALFARHPTRMVPDLDRIRDLAELLDHPEATFPSIQVTGTNGKTTTTAMITALLGALGLSAGGYTSPHLQDVRERIRVAGRLISREQLAAHLDYLEPFLELVDGRHDQQVTFFEVLTATAFLHFSDAPVDVGVFEVGMGGVWDATNLVDGQVGVVLEVARDHAELGSTIAEVAREKAGIIKPGAVAVSGPQQPEAAEVIAAAAAAADARLVRFGEDFDVVDRVPAVGGQQVTLRGVTGEVDEVYLPLFGAHQAVNAACALAAVEGFLGFPDNLDADVVREGFAAVRSPGRLEVVRRDGRPTVVLDGAHNPAGAWSLARSLRGEFGFERRYLVLGILADKDVEAMVDVLAPLADHVVATAPDSPRAADPDRILAAVRRAGISVEEADDVEEALDKVAGLAREGDGIVVTGSLYTVGEGRTALGLEPE